MAKTDDWDDETDDYALKKADGERILNSLSKTKYQTSRHLCINTGLSIEAILDWLDLFDGRRRVLFDFVGETRAYFLPENNPNGRRLFLGGDNSVHIAEVSAKALAVNSNAPKIGDKVVLARNIDYPEAGSRGRAYIDIDADELENLAAQGLSQKRIAEELDIGYTTLQAKLKEMSHLRKAYERGVEEFQKIKGKAAAEVLPPVEKQMAKKIEQPGEAAALPVEKKHGGSRVRVLIDAEAMEKAASQNKTDPGIAAALGVALNTLYRKLKNSPELRAARKRGRQMLKAEKPSPEAAPVNKAAEIIPQQILAEAKEFCGSEPPSEDDPNTIERFMEFRENRRSADTGAESIPGVLVSSPAISLSMTIQIPLGSRSREFIDRIQNLVQEFEI